MLVISKEHVYIALVMNPDKNFVFVANKNGVTNFLFWILFVPHLAKVNDIILALNKAFQQLHGFAHRRFHF